MVEGWLYGWKEIAEYLGCSRSTAYKYFNNLSMPVYRKLGKPRALKFELDEWTRQYEQKSKLTPRSQNNPAKFIEHRSNLTKNEKPVC